jgi:hypothetical protein
MNIRLGFLSRSYIWASQISPLWLRRLLLLVFVLPSLLGLAIAIGVFLTPFLLTARGDNASLRFAGVALSAALLVGTGLVAFRNVRFNYRANRVLAVETVVALVASLAWFGVLLAIVVWRISRT